jgi:hypothetical protein
MVGSIKCRRWFGDGYVGHRADIMYDGTIPSQN